MSSQVVIYKPVLFICEVSHHDVRCDIRFVYFEYCDVRVTFLANRVNFNFSAMSFKIVQTIENGRLLLWILFIIF